MKKRTKKRVAGKWINKGTRLSIYMRDSAVKMKSFSNLQTATKFAATLSGETYIYSTKKNHCVFSMNERYSCIYCKEKIELSDLSLDHITPWIFFGSNSSTNLITCCLSCNKEKGNTLIHDWLQQIKAPSSTSQKIQEIKRSSTLRIEKYRNKITKRYPIYKLDTNHSLQQQEEK